MVMITDVIEVKYRASAPNSILSDKGLRFKLDAIPDNKQITKVYMTNKTVEGDKLMQQFNQYYKNNKARIDNWYEKALTKHYHAAHYSCPF